MSYAAAAAMGALSGLRSMLGPAIVSEAANRKIVRLRRTPLAWLASNRAARTCELLAVGELIADKLPFIPNRTDIPSLVLRAISGALCGMAVSSGRKKEQAAVGAIVGSAAAIAAAYAGYQYRSRVRLPKIAAALLEDAVAVSAGAATISAIRA